MNDTPTSRTPSESPGDRPNGEARGHAGAEPRISAGFAEAVRTAYERTPSDERGAASRTRAALAGELERIRRDAGASTYGPIANVEAKDAPAPLPLHRKPWFVLSSTAAVAATVGLVAIIGLQPPGVSQRGGPSDEADSIQAEAAGSASERLTGEAELAELIEPRADAFADSQDEVGGRTTALASRAAEPNAAGRLARERSVAPTEPAAEPAFDRRRERRPAPTRAANDPRDANGDGSVDVLDAFVIARRLDAIDRGEAERSALPGGWDVNDDGAVNRGDVDALMAAVVRIASAPTTRRETIR
jgi:hypothetical protein